MAYKISKESNDMQCQFFLLLSHTGWAKQDTNNSCLVSQQDQEGQ